LAAPPAADQVDKPVDPAVRAEDLRRPGPYPVEVQQVDDRAGDALVVPLVRPYVGRDHVRARRHEAAHDRLAGRTARTGDDDHLFAVHALIPFVDSTTSPSFLARAS